MRTNISAKKPPIFTHEGARASHITPYQQLRRSLLSCFLWEDEFYEDGVSIANRIHQLCAQVKPSQIAALAIEARSEAKLRHAPLWLLVALAKYGSGTSLVSETIPQVIQRADEMAELVSLYFKANPHKSNPRKQGADLSAQMKKGLAKAFLKFDEYQLSKYNRDGLVKMRDVMFLAHPKGKNAESLALLKRLADNALETADTWEVNLSAGDTKKTNEEKREVWTNMLTEGKLGYLALLRNLRNMLEVEVDIRLIQKALVERKGGADKVLPFRFVAAARHAPKLEPYIDQSLKACISHLPQLSGNTVIMVDVSQSMDAKLSGKSELSRIDAAAALAAVANCESLEMVTFSNNMVAVPPRRGMAGVDAIKSSQPHGGTELFGAITAVNNQVKYDRIIVISDEQAAYDRQSNRIPKPKADKAYMINVASAQNGVGYGNGWTHIDGFSENIFRYIAEVEKAVSVD